MGGNEAEGGRLIAFVVGQQTFSDAVGLRPVRSAYISNAKSSCVLFARSGERRSAPGCRECPRRPTYPWARNLTRLPVARKPRRTPTVSGLAICPTTTTSMASAVGAKCTPTWSATGTVPRTSPVVPCVSPNLTVWPFARVSRSKPR